MNTTYPSDLSDSEWKCLQPYLRESRGTCRTRRHSLRAILNANFYVLRTGCPWRYLRGNFFLLRTYLVRTRCSTYTVTEVTITKGTRTRSECGRRRETRGEPMTEAQQWLLLSYTLPR